MRAERKKQKKWDIGQWKRLVDYSPDSVFISRIDSFKFVEVSRRSCEVYGYTRKEFLEMQIFDIEVDATLVSEVQNLYRNTPIGEVVEVFGHNRRKDGTEFSVHVRFTKVDKEYAMANVRDISFIENQSDLSVLRNRLVSKRTNIVVEEGKLSKRELEVLHLIGKGNTNTEIARKLELSTKTISTYRGRLIQKLGVKNNIALTQYASSIQ